ncbi:MAG: gliding motility-associated C-terminal domain-containing protein [Crocinitomicaceae bacterium]|nr:gliding motility-associated C-terminal domain-containing protein [Crocinitomicaceae bacterium]
MKNYLYTLLVLVFIPLISIGQNTANNCNGAVPGCTSPSFGIQPNNPLTNIVDFTAGSLSNPSNNPNPVPGNSGCLLTGETSSTFITISVVTSGTLQWSIQGATAFGCFDWIMWPYNGLSTCAAITGNTQPPVACNWNGNCNSFTGMAPAGSLPAGANGSNFETPLNVVAGETYLLCLSNFSSTSQNVNLNFFGTANVACEPSAPDQTICLGNAATVTIATPGLTNPTFNWLVTTGVANITAGTTTVTPTVTTTYQVEVGAPATATAPAFIDTISFVITVVTPPAPNAGIDQTVCLGQTITLSGNVSSATNTSSWTKVLPPGLTPPATANFFPNNLFPTPTVVVNQPGVYQFVLNEVNTICGTYRDTVVITVSELTQTVTPTNPSCGGGSDGVISINTPTATEYSFDNGLTWQTGAIKTGLSAGTYIVCSKNALGCQKCTTVTLTDPAVVTLTLSNDTLICQNGTATLIAQAGNGTSFNYTWSHVANQGPSQTASPLVNTYYRVFATNNFGCSSLPDSILVTVRAPISGTLTQNVSICPTYFDSLSAVATGGIGAPYTFTWSTNEISVGSTSKIIVDPITTTTYTVTIKDECESTPLVLTSLVTVYPAPVPMFSVLDNSICEPAVFEMTNLTDPANTGQLFWKISDGQVFFNTNTVLTDTMYQGTYSVQMIVVSPNGCIDSITKTNFLTSHPTPLVDYSWNPIPVTMFNTNVLFLDKSTHADTYDWTFDGAIPPSSTVSNPRVLYPEGVEGVYPVTLIVTSPYGCVDSLSRDLIVNPEILIYAPNVFTPDGNEHNQTWKVFMEGIDISSFHLQIFNRWGNLIWESKDVHTAWDGTYNGEILPDGAYSWTIDALDLFTDQKYNFSGHVTIIK